MSACQDKDNNSKSKYELVTLDWSDDDDDFIVKSSLSKRQPTVVSSVPAPVPVLVPYEKVSKKPKRTIQEVLMSNPSPVNCSKNPSTRVRPEKKPKPKAKIRLPKHLPTDSEFVFDRRSRREAHEHSKVLSLTTEEKDALIAQRVNQVMEEMMDTKDDTVKERHRFHSNDVPIGISQRLGTYVEKGAPLWASSYNQDFVPSSTTAVTSWKNATGAANDEVAMDDSLLALLPPEDPLVSPIAKVPQRNLFVRAGSLSPPHTSPPLNDISPMLNYSTIDTPILKAELKRYGLKPFPRSKAKVLLRHIFNETHK